MESLNDINFSYHRNDAEILLERRPLLSKNNNGVLHVSEKVREDLFKSTDDPSYNFLFNFFIKIPF